MNESTNLYRAEQVRELDRQAIEVHEIAGYTLMNRAGERVFRTLRARWPEARAITVCCGGGNNGGDGYVVARLAREAGLGVQLIALKDPSELAGDAARAARDWLQSGGQVEALAERLRGDVLVDALLGTGLDRAAAGDYARLIEHVNETGRPVIAVDVPSGLDADTGMPLGPCVRADVTVSFIGRKRGLHTGQAGRWCGGLVFDDLGVPGSVYEAVAKDARLLEPIDLHGWLPPRAPDTHKGDLGHVLVIGGDAGMSGAPILAGQAALRAGSGLISLATRAEHASVAIAIQPELMAHGVEDLPALDRRIEKADVLALGPGLGQSDWSKAVWLRALQSGLPLVVDADGLNLLALQEIRAERWVLTPHPGEAARLLDCGVADVQRDRFAAVRALAERYQATVVLKGYGSLVASANGEVAVCPFGGPAMATAGMGDALTGIIASLLGQGVSDFDAACCGVLLHALAADRAAAGRRQILAGDLIASLHRVLPA
ncbi:MAG: NAD(P)H-hydrate dehydratase [Wenzhouxiangella sp.]|nr:MAG: NAD(P)H-hydrate dehydratase [Wenzhouxiangella sp.]